MDGEQGQQPGGKWGDDISDERKAELEQRLHAWEQEEGRSERQGPFDGVKLTGADVFWLCARVTAGVPDTQVVVAKQDALRNNEGDLSRLHLEGADLTEAHLEHAYLSGVHLEGARLYSARLARADLAAAHMELVDLREAHLEHAFLNWVHLEGANLFGAYLDTVDFSDEAHLEGALLNGAHCTHAGLRAAYLEQADLVGADLRGADLRHAHLAGAVLWEAHLEGADLIGTHLEGKRYAPDDQDYLHTREVLQRAQWNVAFRIVHRAATTFAQVQPGADLRGAMLDHTTRLDSVLLGTRGQSAARVADIHWGQVNLAGVDWSVVALLGDEQDARDGPQRAMRVRQPARQERLNAFQAATRANRQVATMLRAQGMTDEANRFAYRAEVCQRHVFRYQRAWSRWLLQSTLGLLAGYGYRLWHLFTAYLVIIIAFAAIYVALGPPNTHGASALTTAGDAFLVSLSAIHGRLFLEQVGRYNVQAWIAAVESVVGIVIEGVFVAMLIQRFFSR